MHIVAGYANVIIILRFEMIITRMSGAVRSIRTLEQSNERRSTMAKKKAAKKKVNKKKAAKKKAQAKSLSAKYDFQPGP